MNWLKTLLASRKLIYAVVGLVLAGLRVQFPELPLPSVELITDAVLALIATHTATDIVHIVSTSAVEWARERGKLSP